ncbi:unnamed protein product [Rodentolepis nana]|uniref:Uncharacterized protein n=1 Tax=Rodentolepis nana TaxID=102285 RepID=A0A3P7U154_RODNA|nr:unnamed protein product [Rodentolepis nana]
MHLLPLSSSGAVKHVAVLPKCSTGSTPVRTISGNAEVLLAAWMLSKSTRPCTRPWKAVWSQRRAERSWFTHRATLNSVYSPRAKRTSSRGPPGTHVESPIPPVGFAASFAIHPRQRL